MSPRHLSLAVALVAVTSTFTGSALADAIGAAAPEQPDGCYVQPPYPLGRSGKIAIPANAPAIPVADQSKNATPTLRLDPLGDLTFTVGPDARLQRTLLIAPSKDLPIGDLTLNWSIVCSKASLGNGVPGVVQLAVTEAAPLPTTIGTLEAGPELVLTLSRELVPFLDVAKIDIRVSDASTDTVFAGGAYGSIGGHTSQIRIGYTNGGLSTSNTSTYHAYASSSMPASFALCTSKTGMVEVPVSIAAHVAGAATDPPPLSGAVALDCDAVNKAKEANDTNTVVAGCSAAPSGGSRTGLGVLAAAFAVATFVRRRFGERAQATRAR